MDQEHEIRQKMEMLMTDTSISHQAQGFLNAFINDFAGKFEEVLEIVEDFIKSVPEGEKELNEFEARRFFERRGRVFTAMEMRTFMRTVDINRDHKVSIVELLLFKYDKTVQQMFATKTEELHPTIRVLQEAIEAVQLFNDQARAQKAQIEELQKLAKEGGVKGVKAQHQITVIQNKDPLGRNKLEVALDKAKRDARVYLKKNDPHQIEQNRLDDNKKKKEDDEIERRRAAKEKIDALAGAMNMT